MAAEQTWPHGVDLNALARVLTALRSGDFSPRMPAGESSLAREIATGLNEALEMNAQLSSEIRRVSGEIDQGALGGQAEIRDVSGDWKRLVDDFNRMTARVTSQVRDLGKATAAIAGGEVPARVTAPAAGEFGEVKENVNRIAAHLNTLADQVGSRSRAMGRYGRLGGLVQVPGGAGAWTRVTDAVNEMVANLTEQVRDFSRVVTAVAAGDLSPRIEVDVSGELQDLKHALNRWLDQLNAFMPEAKRILWEVGTAGIFGGQMEVDGLSGAWKELRDSINFVGGNLTGQVRNLRALAGRLVAGDLGTPAEVDVRGEMLEFRDDLNAVAARLDAVTQEVARVADQLRYVGSELRRSPSSPAEASGEQESRLRVEVRGATGTWKELADRVEGMASEVAGQTRDIARVTQALAAGDLTQKVTVEAYGDFGEIKENLNGMVDQLGALLPELHRLGNEVGVKGILGGQAEMRGLTGTWRDVMDAVNVMAANLTNQIRYVATTLTEAALGNLEPRTGGPRARGEMADLFDVIKALVETLAMFQSQVAAVAREEGIEERLNSFLAWTDPERNVHEVESPLYVAWALEFRATAARRQGDYETARPLYAESLAVARDLGNEWRILYALEGLASIAANTGQTERAGRLFGATEQLRERLARPYVRYPYFQVAADRRAILADEAFARAREEGRQMPLGAAIAEALSPAEG